MDTLGRVPKPLISPLTLVPAFPYVGSLLQECKGLTYEIRFIFFSEDAAIKILSILVGRMHQH